LVTDAELVAEAATALTVVVAGAAIRLARARAIRRINTVAATALSALGAGGAIRSTRRSARPAYALLSICTAVEAAATVALVCLEVYAPVVAAPLAFRAATNLVVSAPDAVPRAALGVPATFPPQTPAIVICQGYPWEGGQGCSQEGPTNQPQRLAPRKGACCKPLGLTRFQGPIRVKRSGSVKGVEEDGQDRQTLLD
jgi:hypothetical protein